MPKKHKHLLSEIERLAPEFALPGYFHEPGRTPRPSLDFGSDAAAFDPWFWEQSRSYRYAFDLFNHGYYWEAHEVWESLWNVCGRRGSAADRLKGLIKLAAGAVKLRAGVAAGAAGHARRAAELFGQRSDQDRFLGVSSADLLACSRRIEELANDLPESRIFDLVLLPRSERWKPTPAQVAAAANRTIPDVIGPGLHGVFIGINPSLYSAAIQRHFGRPGNRFWPALHGAGFTDRLLSPFDQAALLQSGWGITNLVARATAMASELSSDELLAGAAILEEKIRTLQPRVVAVLGVTAYRTAFARPEAAMGPQKERLGGASLWVLPNPSGLNAHFRLADIVRSYADMRHAVLSSAP